MAQLLASFSALLLAGLTGGGTVLAERTLRSGHVLSAQDFSAAAEAGDIAPLIGRELRRTVYPGQPVALEDTLSPRLVRRNETVTLTLVAGNLEITTTGRALADGGQGDRVSVMNLQSRKVVDAIVLDQGKVGIP